MAGTKNKSDKKDRQRKSSQNLRYINERRHAKSHIRRLRVHLARRPHDSKAREAFERYKVEAGIFT